MKRLFLLTLAIMVLAGTFTPISAGILARIASLMQHKDQSISSFHEHLAATKQMPEILSQSLQGRKITPVKYIQTVYRNQYQSVVNPVSNSQFYTSLLPPLNQRLYTPAVALKTDAPDWLCADLAKILITIQLPIKYIVLDCQGESDAVWRNIDDSATLFELRPKTVALCANNRSFFAGLTFHELAHIALNHSNIRTLTKHTLLSSAESTSNQFTILQKWGWRR